MAHKKGAGSSDNGRDSNSKRLGVKIFGGQAVRAGNIIVRQRGTKFHPGENVYMGRDFSIHASVAGTVSFKKRRRNRIFINIIPFEEVAETLVIEAKEVKKGPVVSTRHTDEVIAKEPIPEVLKAKAPKAEDTPPAEAVTKTEEITEVENAPSAETLTTETKEPKEVLSVTDEVMLDEPSLDDNWNDEGKEEKPVEEPSAEVEIPKEFAKVKQDDLKIIEGVGPKISQLLKEGGLETWEKVGAANAEAIKAILEAAGSRYRMHNPTTWPKQARLAHEGKWLELKAYQDYLEGGVEPDKG